MAYKTILIHIDAGDRCRARVELAIGLARRFDAHLIGLNALSRTELPGYMLTGAGGMPIVEIQKRLAAERAERAKAMFDKAVDAAGFSSAEWRTTDQDAIEAVALHARYADLVVLGQPDGAEDAGVQRRFAELVTLEAGRPVLMVPYAGSFRAVGQRILVAWNASREATRAVTDAIPLLQQAEAVEVLTINPHDGGNDGGHGASPGSDIALYLARHAVKVSARVDREVSFDEGNAMLSRAADFGADLIVMGAYGRSRFRELVMGGASRTIIDSMTVPVLLSH